MVHRLEPDLQESRSNEGCESPALGCASGQQRIKAEVRPLTNEPSPPLQGIEVHDWESFLALGKGKPAEPVPPKPDDPATIMYTSGTTGLPHLPHATSVCCASDLLDACSTDVLGWWHAIDPPCTACAAGRPASQHAVYHLWRHCTLRLSICSCVAWLASQGLRPMLSQLAC